MIGFPILMGRPGGIVVQWRPMLRPLPTGIGLRYVRARHRTFFVSFITWVSLAGVGLGVAALITVLSVMNGFEGELRSRLLSLTAHASLTDPAGATHDWTALAARARREPGVSGAAPYSEVQVLLSAGSQLAAATLRGIDPAAERSVAGLDAAMVAGDLDDLSPGRGGIILGRILAMNLGAGPGDRITVLLPRTGAGGGLEPTVGSLEVAGVFEVGLNDHDSVLAYTSLADLAALAGPGAPAGVRLKFADPFAAPARAPAIAAALGAGLVARDWSEEHAAYFHAIRLEKTMMTLILLLIVAVAAFNIVASLVMVVSEKRTDIAILRTLGLTPRAIVAVFMTQGTVIGWSGTALGVALGLAIATHVGTIVPALEGLFGFQVFSADVYYITVVPSEVHAADVVLVAVAALALTLGATVYPALRAARTQPAEALRYA